MVSYCINGHQSSGKDSQALQILLKAPCETVVFMVSLLDFNTSMPPSFFLGNCESERQDVSVSKFLRRQLKRTRSSSRHWVQQSCRPGKDENGTPPQKPEWRATHSNVAQQQLQNDTKQQKKGREVEEKGLNQDFKLSHVKPGNWFLFKEWKKSQADVCRT